MPFRKKKIEQKTLDVDATMQGSLHFKDPVNLRINGRFEGSLETKGHLTIGPQAVVSATINGETVVVAGRVKGKIVAHDKLVLLPTAVVEGEVYPARISIMEGGMLHGTCKMAGDYFGIEELSRFLEVDVHSINEWANQGKIPAVRDGSDWKFERKSIDTWLASGKVGK
ncbi:MAG: polymer-forming cytoskeletal protein [Deltaproteobacteria bacterium]